MTRIAIIGGGIVGLATAYRLSDADRGLDIRIIEKEIRVGAHQSSHNSGVLHCGLHYLPGSAKAEFARKGVRALIRFCERHGVRHEVCGKLVVATAEPEIPRLDELERRGRANGLQGLRRLGPEAAREIEPHVRAVVALHVPEEGIVDFPAVCTALASEVEARGVALSLARRVKGIQQVGGEWRVETSAETFTADYIINCAGLYADRVARMAGVQPACRIVPFRGEYFRIVQDREGLVRHLIYPVPDPNYPFLGVHFTRRVAGGVEAGPNAVLAFAREGYTRGTVNLGDLVDALGYVGLRRFVWRHARVVAHEAAQSLSKRRFCRALQRLVPEIRPADLEPGGAGVRAQALAANGALIHDFLIEERARALHVINAPSPAATASLAIGESIAQRVTAALAG